MARRVKRKSMSSTTISLDRDRDNRMEDEEEEALFRSVDSFVGHSEFGNGN